MCSETIANRGQALTMGFCPPCFKKYNGRKELSFTSLYKIRTAIKKHPVKIQKKTTLTGNYTQYPL